MSLICPHCEQTEEVLKKQSHNQKCKKCDTEMVPLEGFSDKIK